MKKERIIRLRPEKFKDLQRRVGKGRTSVYMALRFATSGEDPDRIRELALKEYGGVIDTVTRL